MSLSINLQPWCCLNGNYRVLVLEGKNENWLLITYISFSLISKVWCISTDSSSTSLVARLIRFSVAAKGSFSCKYGNCKYSCNSCLYSIFMLITCLVLFSGQILHSSYVCWNRHWKKPYCPLPFTQSMSSSLAAQLFSGCFQNLLHHKIRRKARLKTIASMYNMHPIHEVLV